MTRILVTLALLASSVQARVIIVNDFADLHDGSDDGFCAVQSVGADCDCTLRAAVEQANLSVGEDTIELPAGVYELTLGQLIISDGTMIKGMGTTRAAVNINLRSPTVRAFKIQPSALLELENLTITDLRSNSGEDTAADPDSNTKAKGGCIYNGGSLNVNNIRTKHCESKREQTAIPLGKGGTLYNDFGSAFVGINSTFETSISNWGAGIFNYGLVTLTDFTLEDDHTLGLGSVDEDVNYPEWQGIGELGDSAGGGAGIANFEPGVVNGDRVSFIYDRARLGLGGGGILNGDECTCFDAASCSELTRFCNVSVPNMPGRAIMPTSESLGLGGTITLTNATFSRNRCRRCGGGALKSSGGTINLNLTLVSATQSYWESGIILNRGAVLNVNHFAVDGTNISRGGDILTGPIEGAPRAFYNCFIDASKPPLGMINVIGPNMDDFGDQNPPRIKCAEGFLSTASMRIPSQEQFSKNSKVKVLVPNSGTRPSPLIDAGDLDCGSSHDARYEFRPIDRLTGLKCDIGAVEIQPGE